MDDLHNKLAYQFSLHRGAHFMLQVPIQPYDVECERDDCPIAEELDRTELWMPLVEVFGPNSTHRDEQLTQQSSRHTYAWIVPVRRWLRL